MSEAKRIDGIKYMGEVPKVFVQAPFDKISDNCARCTGCNCVVHCLDLNAAICPYCVAREMEASNE
jgi:hypothetical protein